MARAIRLLEDPRCSLLGNSFQRRVVACLTEQLFLLRGFLSKLPTASDLADPAAVPAQWRRPSGCNHTDPPTNAQAWRERDLGNHLPQTPMYTGLQTHKGSEVRQETSGRFRKHGLPQSVDGRLWKWKTLISGRWKTKDEHINTLAGQTIRLLPNWECRSQLRMNLVDNTSLLEAFIKGSSRSRRMEVRNSAYSSLCPSQQSVAAEGIFSLSPQVSSPRFLTVRIGAPGRTNGSKAPCCCQPTVQGWEGRANVGILVW